MSQTDRNSATTTPPSPPPQLQDAVDAAEAAQAAAEAAQTAAEAAEDTAVAAAATAVNRVAKTSDTGSAVVPKGTTAQRDAVPQEGYFRYNETLDSFEGYRNGAWGAVGGGATGGGTDSVFYLNSQTVTTNYSIPTGQNAVSAGPVTIADGVNVTIADGSSWSIV